MFQDPDNSLDPRMRIGNSISEILRAHDVLPRQGTGERMSELLAEAGLDPAFAERYPAEIVLVGASSTRSRPSPSISRMFTERRSSSWARRSLSGLGSSPVRTSPIYRCGS